MLSSSEFHRQIKENVLHELIGKYTKSNPRRKRVYLFETKVAGFNYYEGKDKEVAKLLVPDTELILVREPENEYDEKAIAIYTEQGNKLGYVPRDENHIPAAMADADIFIGAEIVKFKPDLILIAPWECLFIRVFQSMKKEKTNPFITLVCPQCGGGMDFEAGISRIKCPWCGVVHILLGVK